MANICSEKKQTGNNGLLEEWLEVRSSSTRVMDKLQSELWSRAPAQKGRGCLQKNQFLGRLKSSRRQKAEIRGRLVAWKRLSRGERKKVEGRLSKRGTGEKD